MSGIGGETLVLRASCGFQRSALGGCQPQPVPSRCSLGTPLKAFRFPEIFPLQRTPTAVNNQWVFFILE